MSSNKFGFLLKDYTEFDKAKQQILRDLNQGCLGLLLGAGASSAIGLPNWPKLVLSIANEIFPGEGHIYDDTQEYDIDVLKALIARVNTKLANQSKYFDLVRVHLYNSVTFDFKTASKDLLIAISALTVGAKRGTVQNIVTLNFDSVLEWYLDTLGLEINVLSTKQLFHRRCDVNITHIHGFLPYQSEFGPNSDFLIFSKREFEDRVMNDKDYWRGHLIEYFRRHVFLSVGLSATSLENDVCVYLRYLNNWYTDQKISREKPYGYAFIYAPEVRAGQTDILIDTGVVPILYNNHDDVPKMIFEIAKLASQAS